MHTSVNTLEIYRNVAHICNMICSNVTTFLQQKCYVMFIKYGAVVNYKLKTISFHVQDFSFEAKLCSLVEFLTRHRKISGFEIRFLKNQQITAIKFY